MGVAGVRVLTTGVGDGNFCVLGLFCGGSGD